MLDWRLLRRTLSASALLLNVGCASTQLNYNTVEVSSTIDNIYVRQTLNNLSKFIDDPNAIPSQVMMVGGTIQTVNTINPSITFPITAQLAKTATATPTLLTLASANTLAGVGAGVNGTNSAEQNYTIAPLNDANTLRNQRALYRHAVLGTRLISNYQTPQVFFQDKFYDDPYHLQLPHCVLCAIKQGEFSGELHPPVYENKELPPKWLYWESHPRINELSSKGEMIDLGHYGNHELFMTWADYYDGVLTNFVIFTLPNTEPTETFTAVDHVTPGTPGGTTAPSAIIRAPASGSNIRMAPATRQGPALVVPQGIQPIQ